MNRSDNGHLLSNIWASSGLKMHQNLFKSHLQVYQLLEGFLQHLLFAIKCLNGMWASRGMGWWKRHHEGKNLDSILYSYPNAIHSLHTLPQHESKETLSVNYTRQKFIASAHVPIKIILFSWLEHCPFYPFFYSFSKFYLASFSVLSFSDYYKIINCSKHCRRCYSNKLHPWAHRISCDKKSLITFWNLMNKHSKMWLNTHERSIPWIMVAG